MPADGDDRLSALLAQLGHVRLASSPGLAAWSRATDRLLALSDPAEPTCDGTQVAAAWRWSREVENLLDRPRDGWFAWLAQSRLVSHLGPSAIAHFLARQPQDLEAIQSIAVCELTLARLATLGDQNLLDQLAMDTRSAIALLTTLRDEPPIALGRRIQALLPEVGALAAVHDPSATVEQEGSPQGDVAQRPLLDHACDRALGRKLWGLESADQDVFEQPRVLPAATFQRLVELTRHLDARQFLPCVRTALVFLDFAKGGTSAHREAWTRRAGIDLSIHNVAARQILGGSAAGLPADRGRLVEFPWFRARPERARLVLALVESHGVCGQVLRGETPWRLLAPWVRHLRSDGGALVAELGLSRELALRLAADCLHLVNVCDTAAVREGLMTEDLYARFEEIELAVAGVVSFSSNTDVHQIECELAAAHRKHLASASQLQSPTEIDRVSLVQRFLAMRAGRHKAGETEAETRDVINSLSPESISRLAALADRCQFWYAEAGTSALSARSQVKLLVAGMRAGDGLETVAGSGTFHVNCLPLVTQLGARSGPAGPYRVRLVEALLANVSLTDVLAHGLNLGARENAAETPLIRAVASDLGAGTAVTLCLEESEEARALLTLLPIYERRNSAAFHSTLKSLCDVYDLRKDEFDRVANEELYLATMNSARGDKERMLDFVRPGRIVEVGPGGGIVLDLLAARFPDSKVTGVDASRMVIEKLQARRKQSSCRWNVIEGDAFQLPQLLDDSPVDSVIFCSVLHEIYSYVEYPGDNDKVPQRFRLESVRDLLQACWKTLATGGRLVIRDGVAPPAGQRLLRLLTDEAREYLELFVRQFEGRPIRYQSCGDDQVMLSTADAMEFLYTYTWGPASFPYEVREQYGVLTLDEYRRCLVEWLTGPDSGVWLVPVPDDLASYLQPGYVKALAGKIELCDISGKPVPLPDSNCLLVAEKTPT